MTVELWMGEEFEYGKEVRALMYFLKDLENRYGADEALCTVNANFICNNLQIDLFVVKPNAFIVIDLKEAGGPIKGSENGEWKVQGSSGEWAALHGGSHKNPYQQIRSQRYSLRDLLREHKSEFLLPRAGSPPEVERVTAMIAISPNYHPSSVIDVPKGNWLHIVGIDVLGPEVFAERNPGLKLQE